MKCVESNKILSDYQHGLRKRRSCETQLITTKHHLAVWLNRRQQVDVILWDLSMRLIMFHIIGNPVHYGIRYKKLSWIQSYHADRNQQVGRHLFLLLSHMEFHKLRSLYFSCSWYTYMTCPQEFRLRYEFFCWWLPSAEWAIREQKDAESLQTDLDNLQKFNRFLQLVFNTGNVQTFGSPTSKMAYRLYITFIDRL